MKDKALKSSDKVRIFYQDSSHKIEKNGKTEKKDKKNIVKNIIKIFISWLEKKKIDKAPEEFEKAEKELKNVLTVENFNNRLIKSIISNEVINSIFFTFLIHDANEEVKYSRIHDKESHYEAIELYKKVLDEKGNSKILRENEDFNDQEKRENVMKTDDS